MDSIPRPSEQHIPDGLNLFKSFLFPTLIVLGFWVADRIGSHPAQWLPGSEWSGQVLGIYKWTIISIISAFVCALIIGMGILAHDAVHKVLFQSHALNEIFGALLSAFALLPFYSNRQFHLTHHSYAHQPGKDPENLFHNRSFYSAFTLGSVLALWSQYQLLVSNMFFRFGDRRYQGRVVKDLLALLVAFGSYYLVIKGMDLDPSFTILPTLVLLPLIFGFRAISDHYGLPAINRNKLPREDVLEPDIEQWHREHNNMQREVTGWVILSNPVLNWLWSNVNYHEVHHKFPYLSYIYLPRVFSLTRKELPYEVTRGYLQSIWKLRGREYYHTGTSTEAAPELPGK